MKDNRNRLILKVDRQKGIRLFLFAIILVGLVVAIFQILRYTNLWEKVNSVEKLRAIVEKGGIFSELSFMLLQLLQTTILQIPSILVTATGAVIFGRGKAFLLSYVAVVLGSIIMFLIGRKVGRKFLNWLVGKDSANNWINKMTNGKYLFMLMMLFPLFPDDILCAVAGVTNMSFKFFLFTNLLSRGIGIFSTVFFSSGQVIPFTGWGLVVWVLIAVGVALLFYLSVKYQDKIDKFFNLKENKK